MSKIYLIAGEASGDFLGARLIAALRAQDSAVEIVGVGGLQMQDQGLQSLFPMNELSVMGIAEVLPRLPRLLSRIAQTVRDIERQKPDIVVSIDAPDFVFRVAKRVRKSMAHSPKLIHYVAPTVWAWREGRAAKIARFLDGLICLFDFEPPYFERHGLKSIAAGHPLVEGGALEASGAAFRVRHGLSDTDAAIGVLFGSRKGELKRTGTILRDTAFDLAARIAHEKGGNTHIIAPTLPHVKDDVLALLSDCPVPVHVTTDASEKYEAFKAMDVALAVSGTVGLELAALEVPHVVAYRANPVSAFLIRRLIKVKYAHLANIMLGREVVPEFLQEKAVPGDIAVRAFDLWRDPSAQKEAFRSIRHKIGADQDRAPSEKAAAFVLSFLAPPVGVWRTGIDAP